jgi:hypothetical protein
VPAIPNPPQSLDTFLDKPTYRPDHGGNNGKQTKRHCVEGTTTKSCSSRAANFAAWADRPSANQASANRIESAATIQVDSVGYRDRQFSRTTPHPSSGHVAKTATPSEDCRNAKHRLGMGRIGRDNRVAPSTGGAAQAARGDGSDNALKKAASSAASEN